MTKSKQEHIKEMTEILENEYQLYIRFDGYGVSIDSENNEEFCTENYVFTSAKTAVSTVLDDNGAFLAYGDSEDNIEWELEGASNYD